VNRGKIISYGVAAVLAVVLILVLRSLFADDEPDDAAPAGKKCSGETTALRVATSPEKAAVVERLAQAYSGRTVAGTCVEVEVESKSSGAAMQALADGWNEAEHGPRPDVWTPAASGWVTILRQQLTENDRSGVLTDAKPESIASAPLVIAMPKPMAQALGWPDKSISWKQLAELATDKQGWAKYDHPEWGKFRLGKTNPNLSTSGLNATIGAYAAATGTTSDLTEADLQKPKVRALVKSVEQSIVHYGDTTLTFLANLQDADDRGAAMSYISAVTVEENSVIAYNQGNPSGSAETKGRHGKPKVPLVAIYPSDGTLLSDHPYTVLAWADETRQRIAADFGKFLRSEPSQAKFQAEGFRSFDAKPGPVLREENGVLPDAKLNLRTSPSPPVLAKLLESWSQLRKPANVLLVMDVSGSMANPVEDTGKSRLELAKQAAVVSLKQFGDQDKVGLWIFSTDLVGEQDHRQLVSLGKVGDEGRRDQLRDRIKALIPTGGTALYDTTLAAREHMTKKFDDNAINAVVVLTDGRNENAGGISLEKLLAGLQSEDTEDVVRVFTIGYSEEADQETLRGIAKAARGAQYDSSDSATIDQVFTAVISNF
jgi:Ca-activated chloride channel family protein